MPVVVVRPADEAVAAAPPILLLHEITGPSPACLDFAARLAERGPFVVYVPQMFGRTNESGFWLIARNFAHVFVSFRWHPFLAARTSPIMRDIEPLVDRISQEHSGSHLGAIGMCLTGTWPLALMADPRVRIGVLCQPALPFFAWTTKRKAALALTETDLQRGVERIRKDHLTVLGFRFAKDGKSTSNRFERVRTLCGSEGRFVDGTILQADYGDTVESDAHSVFCGSYSDSEGHPTRLRLEQLIEEFRSVLGGHHPTIPSRGAAPQP